MGKKKTVMIVMDPGAPVWRRQIRFPLLQSHFAAKLNCPLADVAVGVYSVPNGAHELHRFSASRVSTAQAEMASLAKRLQ